MLNKSFVAIAMLSFAFTATAFGQKEIVVWQAAKGAKNVKQTPQQPQTGSLIDTSTGEIVWVKGKNPNSSRMKATGTAGNTTAKGQLRPKGIGGGAAGGALAGGAVARTTTPRRVR